MHKLNQGSKTRQADRDNKTSACQNDAESCKGSDAGINRAIYMVTIKSFNFNSIHSIIVKRLKQSVAPQKPVLEHKIDLGRDGNLMPVNICKVLCPKTTMAELANYKNTNIIIFAYNRVYVEYHLCTKINKNYVDSL